MVDASLCREDTSYSTENNESEFFYLKQKLKIAVKLTKRDQ